MNIPGETQSAPGYGSVRSPVVLVGQSLCGRLCMEAQIPFTGGSGRFIDESLAAAGLAKADVFTTNVVHCHPPRNRRSHDHEIKNCRPYLVRELEIVQPRLIIGLGRDASAAVRSMYPDACQLRWPFRADEVSQVDPKSPYLLPIPHPSWIKWQPAAVRDAYVDDFARALAWAFDKTVPQS